MDDESVRAFSSLGKRIGGLIVNQDDRARSNVNIDLAERCEKLSLAPRVWLDNLIFQYTSLAAQDGGARYSPLQWSNLARLSVHLKGSSQ
jgi:hypothetical protein